MSIHISGFWDKYGNGFLIALVVVLVVTIAFRAGRAEEAKSGAAKINISLVSKIDPGEVSESAKVIDEALKRKGIEARIGNVLPEETKDTRSKQECALIASKNSTKFHLPNCKNATKIKDSNLVCFSSVEEAKLAGYEPAKCCHK